jgi:hypothetical protein
MMVQRLAAATNRKSVPRKPRYFAADAQADLFDLLLDAGDDDFQQVLPAGTLRSVESLRVMSFDRPPARASVPR